MDKVSVGQLIKNRRIELSLTLRQVADKVGVTEATVSRWEHGKIDNMRRDKIAKLATVLDMSPLRITGIDENENFLKPVNIDESELLDDYRKIGDADKIMIRSLLKRLHLDELPSNPSLASNDFHNDGDIKNNFVAYGGTNAVNQNVSMRG